jgi:hypothetical protein
LDLRKRKEERGLGKLHNEELHNVYSSSSISRMMKSKRMTWGRHVARRGEEEYIQDFGWKGPRKGATRKTDVGRMILLKWILER